LTSQLEEDKLALLYVLGTVEVSNLGIGITVVDCNLMAEKELKRIVGHIVA
jgi:hypothetical protein